MSSAQTQPHTWAVTGQEEEPTIDSNGDVTTLHHISFKTNTGHESTVTVPDADFTAANVANAITAKAAQIVAVHSLNSTNAPSAGG